MVLLQEYFRKKYASKACFCQKKKSSHIGRNCRRGNSYYGHSKAKIFCRKRICSRWFRSYLFGTPGFFIKNKVFIKFLFKKNSLCRWQGQGRSLHLFSFIFYNPIICVSLFSFIFLSEWFFALFFFQKDRVINKKYFFLS